MYHYRRFYLIKINKNKIKVLPPSFDTKTSKKPQNTSFPPLPPNPKTKSLKSLLTSCCLLYHLFLQVSSVVLHYRFLRSRHPVTRHLTLPFKTLELNNFLLLSSTLIDLAIDIERPFAAAEDDPAQDEVDDSDELHLMPVNFIASWVMGGDRQREVEEAGDLKPLSNSIPIPLSRVVTPSPVSSLFLDLLLRHCCLLLRHCCLLLQTLSLSL